MTRIFIYYILGVAAVLLGLFLSQVPDTNVGAITALTSSDTQNTERATVNNIANLVNNFSTTSNNTFTGNQVFTGSATTTFAAGLYASLVAAPYFNATSSSATSTFQGGLILNTGCLLYQGACLTSPSFLLASNNTWTGLQAFSNTGTTTFSGGLYATQIAAPYFFATSTSATSTFNGSVTVLGNLQVAGNFYAPVNIVASEEFGIVDGTVSAPAIFFNSDPDTGIYRNGANGVGLSGGGAGATWTGSAFQPNTTNARDLGGTSNIWNKLYANHASTTDITATNSFFLESRLQSPYQFVAFTYATTSWAGTTTVLRTIAPFTGTALDIQCDQEAGTLNAMLFVNSTGVTPMFSASTTAGTVTFSANNTFTKGDTLQLQLGTPASSPLDARCTVRTYRTS